MKARNCDMCGCRLSRTNIRGRRCGRCAQRLIREATERAYVYQRTHIHTWPDGAKTVELGTTCEGVHE